ncbi:MAG: class I SAM-dependent methyltransferase family protein [Candidatus Micrarchaeaceae archaeon]
MPDRKGDFVRVRKEAAEKVRKLLMRNNVIDGQRYVKHSPSYVLFPVIGIESERIKKLLKGAGAEVVKAKGKKKLRSIGYYDLLKKSLNGEELAKLVKGYDLLGNIALVEIPKDLEKKRGAIANAILKANRNIETVLEKAGPVSGEYRIRSVRHIAGKKGFIANYSENGCRMVFDVRRTFFSNRLSYERSRITALVKEGEKVVVMFAGVGPFVVEIAKAHKSSMVVGIEKNKHACTYMKKNIELNGLKNAKAVQGDVRKEFKRYLEYADRVVMPLPKDSLGFINEAVAMAKDVAVIHVYAFCSIGGAKELEEKIVEQIKKSGAEPKLIFSRVVRPYSAKEEERVMDFSIKK